MKITENIFLDALYSNKANPELEEQKNVFGQFIGEWEFEWFGYEAGREAEQEKGEWIFSWVLDGRVIQDLWIIPGLNRRNLTGVPKGEYGTTLRFYNDNTKVWNVIWLGPIKNRLNTFEARKIGEEIIMEETNSKNGGMKWIFSEISENSFRWKSIICEDGENWRLAQEMLVTRKK